ncbi:2573_t:CDS:1, partial [Dentiscutata heterogama]
MSNYGNKGPASTNSTKKSDWFSYLYSEDIDINADGQGFNYRYFIKNIDNAFKQAIDQKKSHCRLKKVVFTFVPEQDVDYRTLTYYGRDNEVPKDKNKLNAFKMCFEYKNGGISQRKVLVENDFRRSSSPCNQERTYVLYSTSDNFEEGK